MSLPSRDSRVVCNSLELGYTLSPNALSSNKITLTLSNDRMFKMDNG